MHDLHAHSNYSDGSPLWRMVAAAEKAGLDSIGFADHCTLSGDEAFRQHRRVNGFALDVTVDRRRDAIATLRDETGMAIHDAVEVDFLPGETDRIRSFLDGQPFDYTLGSVHHIGTDHIMDPRPFRGMSVEEKRAVIDRYVDRYREMAMSGLFDIVAHIDVFERNPELRGVATDEHRDGLVAAVVDAGAVTEVNAGRVLGALGEMHPAPAMLERLREADVPVTVGSDAHRPGELVDRASVLDRFVAEHGIDPVGPDRF